MATLSHHHIKFMIVCFILIMLGLSLYVYKKVSAQQGPGNNRYTISGFIYYDADFSDTITPGDPLYKDPERPLVSFHINPIDRYAGNKDGYYRFRNIRSGVYIVETLPNPLLWYGKFFVFPPGNLSGAHRITVTNSDIQNLNFLVQPFPLRGKVYKDENGNSMWDVSEPFVGGATVAVYRRGTKIGNFSESPDRTISSVTYVSNVSDPADVVEQYNYVIGGPAGSFTMEIIAMPAGCQLGSAQTVGIDYEGFDERGNKADKNFNPANFALIDTPDPSDAICGTTVPTPVPSVIPTITPTVTPVPRYQVKGTVYEDASKNYCQGGMTPIPTSTVSLFQGGVQVGNSTSDSTGVYTISNALGGSSVVSFAPVPSGYRIVQPVGVSTFLPFNNYLFTLDADKTFNVCLTTVGGWFQSGMFDVRFAGRLENPVPITKKASIETDFPSVFFSSTQTIDIPDGRISGNEWKVENEYSSNHTPEIGHLSYTYFESHARRTGEVIESISCANDSVCVIEDNPVDGITRLVGSSDFFTLVGPGAGRIQLTGDSKRMIILSEKPVVIASEVSIDLGSIFILASKDRISVAPTIGQDTATSQVVDLTGIFSSEKDIVIEGDKCNEGDNPDKRLNIAGNIITNAKEPFAKSGAGLVITRSLCALPGGDPDNPVLFIANRPDFILALGEQYKAIQTKWVEISPE